MSPEKFAQLETAFRQANALMRRLSLLREFLTNLEDALENGDLDLTALEVCKIGISWRDKDTFHSLNKNRILRFLIQETKESINDTEGLLRIVDREIKINPVFPIT